jgi:hypothetical protein
VTFSQKLKRLNERWLWLSKNCSVKTEIFLSLSTQSYLATSIMSLELVPSDIFQTTNLSSRLIQSFAVETPTQPTVGLYRLEILTALRGPYSRTSLRTPAFTREFEQTRNATSRLEVLTSVQSQGQCFLVLA